MRTNYFMNLFEKYGYCIIPKGTVLYRQGSVVPYHGAFFSLYPTLANDFKTNSKAKVAKWVVVRETKVLFVVSHLKWNGFGATTIQMLFEEIVEPLNEMDDLDVKWRNINAKMKLVRALERFDIKGWLASQEGMYPLEVFLLPNAIRRVKLLSHYLEPRKAHPKNSLRKIQIKPTDFFYKKSRRLTNENKEYLKGFLAEDESDYSLYRKLFLKE